ncbi:MAG: FGGY family carbohydrate kinase [Candidatus Krumholzibacteria bacterium]
MTARAAAIDLGSTRIKSGVLDATDELVDIRDTPAPPLAGDGLIRECEPAAYMEAASRLLAETLSHLPEDVPVGIASQRSSFLLWNAESGQPVTPMISWQDRRAHEWCLAHARHNENLVTDTGLFLSPHYAAPKLAFLLTGDKALRQAARAGELRFGTLETYLVWRLTAGRVHVTDLTMAARTLLADPRSGRWSPRWLEAFGVAESLLPRIVPTWGRQDVLADGGVVTATVTDQAAGVIALLATEPGTGGRPDVLVNLGTGGFVTIPTGDEMTFAEGYLSGPLISGPDGEVQYTIEGTVNGIGATLSQAPPGELDSTAVDPSPGVFCSPDSSGLGAPYWRADVPFVLSRPDATLGALERRRVILEGIVFRIAGIIKALCGGAQPRSIVLSGGLLSERFIPQALASCLQHPVYVVDNKESTLLGAARLAAGEPHASPEVHQTPVEPESASYLPAKFPQWRVWMDDMLLKRPTIR